MPRYSLNLRPKYAPGELTGPERFSQAAGQAFDAYAANDAANRDEENQMARAGATRLPDEPQQGVMDRLRGIGGAIRRTLGGGGTPQGTPPFAPGQVGQPDITRLQAPRVPGRGPSTEFVDPNRQFNEGGTPADGGRPMPFPTRRSPADQLAAAPSTDMPGVESTPNRYGGYGAPPVESPAQQTPQGGASRPTTIGDAIKPIVLRGRGNSRYEVDPLREQKIALQGRELEKNADEQRQIAGEGRKQASLNENQSRQIRALTDAGMPADEARARVLTGTVRYDETFGQYRPNNGNLSPDERSKLQKQKDDAAYQRALLGQQGKQNTEEYRQATLALQTASTMLAISNARAQEFDRSATDAGSQVPKNPIDRQIATSTPAGKAQVAAAESTQKANRDSARNSRERGAAAAESTVRSGGSKKLKINQSQYDNARKKINPKTNQPYTADEIAALYDFDPTVKR